MLTSPGDAHLLYSKPLIFNFDFFLGKALNGFGVKDSSLSRFWEQQPRSKNNPSGKCLVHVTEDIYKRNLLPGRHLNSLVKSHQASLNHYLSFEQLACRCGLSAATRTDQIPLYNFITEIMMDSMQACLFDPIVLSIDSSMTRDMMSFTDDLWMLMHPTAMVDGKKPRSILKRYLKAMKIYQTLPASMRQKESQLVTELINQYHEYGIDEDDSAAVLVMVYWA